MEYNVNRIIENRDFMIYGMSYIGAPRSNTAMFITRKVEHLLSALEPVNECLVFAEDGIAVPEKLLNNHAFHFSAKPQQAYAKFAEKFAEERFIEERKLKFNLMPGGYYVSEDVTIPDDAYIEPGCVIGPDVEMGKNARILAGTIIKHTSIGDNFFSNQYAVIGSNGFTMAEDENGNKLRIPTLGKVIIGSNVEIGVHDNISCGSGGDTVIEDYVKIDALVHIGHDNHLCKNVEVAAGTILGGFVTIGKNTFMGINSTVRNRINIGDSAFVSMSSAVMKEVGAETSVLGNPARVLPPDKR